MSQISFSDAEYAGKRKKTRREVFLEEMEAVVPWKALLGLIEPHYPVAGRGRRPYPLDSMLRVHLMQNWFALSDPAMEEALYEIASLRAFAHLSLGEPIPDETTILNFRHLLGANDLAEDILRAVNAHLARKGLLLKRGSIVDATIIAAPSSTKNADGERDPEMHQTRKGNQWHFGMKVHVGADARSGLVHAAVVTAANVHDKHAVPELLHGEETRVYGDRGYQGCTDLIKDAAPNAKDFTNRRVRQPWGDDEVMRAKNRTKNRTRARVEHVFHVLKRQFGFAKVRYRGLMKNANRVFTALALVNLVMAQRRMPALVRL